MAQRSTFRNTILRVRRNLEQGQHIWALNVPWKQRKTATWNDARWNKALKCHLYRGAKLPEPLQPFRSEPFSWERWVEDEINETRHTTEPTGDISPRPHQEEAIELLRASFQENRAGFMLADDVGLGKTISAWEFARTTPEIDTVLIVCPLDVVAHWRKTIQKMGSGRKRIMIVNYARLNRAFETTRDAQDRIASLKGLARYGDARDYDLFIVDESHKCKNMAAARSKLAEKLVAASDFTCWLSATAGQNPLELSYLRRLLADLTGDQLSELKDFERWCQNQGIGVRRGAFGRWEWDGAEEDCELIRQLLFEGEPPGGLRRRPEQIAGWPEINRILHPVGLDPEQKQLYEKAWSQFRREMKMTPDSDPQHRLVVQLRFRQKASLIRVNGTVELALDLLENNRQVAISVAYHETLDKIREKIENKGFECAQIHGKMDAKTKEANRMSFQRGEKKVMLFTVREGISLHQGEYNDVARAEIIHDLRWSAIQMAQIEGRCHRDGKFAQMYWMYADGTIEERIARVVAQRVRSMQSMVGDDTETIQEIENLLQEAA